MFLPSGFQMESGTVLVTKPIGKGLYAVEGAYRGNYDFFAPSPLFKSLQEQKPAGHTQPIAPQPPASAKANGG